MQDTLRSGFDQLMHFLEYDPVRKSTVRRQRPGWANARDAETVYKELLSARSDRVFESGGVEAVPAFTLEDAAAALEALLSQRPTQRTSVFPPYLQNRGLPPMDAQGETAHAPPPAETVMLCQECVEEGNSDAGNENGAQGDEEEPGGGKTKSTDEENSAWEALNAAQKAAWNRKVEDSLKKSAAAATDTMAKQEAQAQQCIRQLGLCPMSYRWRKIGSGYQCEGGSHFLSDAQVNAM